MPRQLAISPDPDASSERLVIQRRDKVGCILGDWEAGGRWPIERKLLATEERAHSSGDNQLRRGATGGREKSLEDGRFKERLGRL